MEGPYICQKQADRLMPDVKLCMGLQVFKNILIISIGLWNSVYSFVHYYENRFPKAFS